MRVIIAGSRDFHDYNKAREKILDILSGIEDIEIISGTARGADRIGEEFAQEFGLRLSRFPAKWNLYGKSAGYIRNREMAEYAKKQEGCLIAFWDMQSRGTKHMIDIARKSGLQVWIFNTKTMNIVKE